MRSFAQASDGCRAGGLDVAFAFPGDASGCRGNQAGFQGSRHFQAGAGDAVWEEVFYLEVPHHGAGRGTSRKPGDGQRGRAPDPGREIYP